MCSFHKKVEPLLKILTVYPLSKAGPSMDGGLGITVNRSSIVNLESTFQIFECKNIGHLDKGQSWHCFSSRNMYCTNCTVLVTTSFVLEQSFNEHLYIVCIGIIRYNHKIQEIWTLNKRATTKQKHFSRQKSTLNSIVPFIFITIFVSFSIC